MTAAPSVDAPAAALLFGFPLSPVATAGLARNAADAAAAIAGAPCPALGAATGATRLFLVSLVAAARMGPDDADAGAPDPTIDLDRAAATASNRRPPPLAAESPPDSAGSPPPAPAPASIARLIAAAKSPSGGAAAAPRSPPCRRAASRPPGEAIWRREWDTGFAARPPGPWHRRGD